MAQPAPEMKYEDTREFSTKRSQTIVAKVTALLFLRGINCGLDFQLETKETGTFQNTCFQIRRQTGEWVSYSIQLKCCEENSSITKRTLTDPKSPIALVKIIRAYEGIKDVSAAAEKQVPPDDDVSDRHFVIFTNVRPDLGLEGKCCAFEQINEFLGSSSGKVFRFDSDKETGAEEAISDYPKNCADEERDFLKWLRICVDHLSEDKFEDLIKEEMRKVVGGTTDDVELNFCCVCFIANLKESLEEKTYVLHRESDIFVSVPERVQAILQAEEDANKHQALRLCKFSKDDQRHYLKWQWVHSDLATVKEMLSGKELDNFISRLLAVTSQSIEDSESDFLGIPLQTQMMAEVFVDLVISPAKTLALPETLDLLQLLELFVEKKLQVFVQDQLKIKFSEDNYDMHLSSFRSMFFTNHMEAALVVQLLNNDYVKELESKGVIGDLSDFLHRVESGEYKTGFIDRVIEGKARFVHKVFAEYFTAKWLAANLPEYAWFTGFYGTKGGAQFLCDRILAKGCQLHTAVLNENVSKVKMLLAEGADVNARDRGGRTPLHLTAGFGFMASTEAKHVEILDLLIESPGIDLTVKDDILKATPLQQADRNEYWLMIDKLLARNMYAECIVTILNDLKQLHFLDYMLANDSAGLMILCLDKNPGFHDNPMPCFSTNLTRKGNGLLANACQNGCYRIAKLLVEKGYDINGPSPRNKTFRYPPLHCAAQSSHLDIVKLLVNASISSPSSNEVQKRSEIKESRSEANEFVNRKAACNLTALHLALKYGHTDVADFFITNGAESVIQHNNETVQGTEELQERMIKFSIKPTVAIAFEDLGQGGVKVEIAAIQGLFQVAELDVQMDCTLIDLNSAQPAPSRFTQGKGFDYVVKYLTNPLDKDKRLAKVLSDVDCELVSTDDMFTIRIVEGHAKGSGVTMYRDSYCGHKSIIDCVNRFKAKHF